MLGFVPFRAGVKKLLKKSHVRGQNPPRGHAMLEHNNKYALRTATRQEKIALREKLGIEIVRGRTISKKDDFEIVEEN